MPERASAVIAVALVLTLGARAAGSRGAPTATPVPRSLIAFVRYTPNGFGSDDLATLYLVHPDGSGLRRLTEPGPDGATEARLSPDRSTIAFVGTTADSWGCALVSTRPGSKPQLYSKACTSHPAWSPDGNQLAFNLPEHGIATGALDGSNIRPVPHTNAVERDAMLDWSPDGRTLVFNHVAPSRTFPPSAFLVSTIRSDGTGLRQIAADAAEPRFAPDGRLILYEDATGHQLHTVQPDGTGNHIRLTLAGRFNEVGSAAWSPDSRSIVYSDGAGLHLLDLVTDTRRLIPLPPRLCTGGTSSCGDLDWR